MATNTELRDIYTQKVIPEQTNYQEMNEVSFLIDDRDKTWTDITNLELEVTLQIMREDGTAFPDADDSACFLENNALHTLFEKAEFEIQGHVVRTEGNYAMRSYIENLITYTEEVLNDKEVFEGFYATKVGADLSAGPTVDAATRLASPSVHKRQEEQVRGSPEITLIGRLRTDLTQQGKNMIPATSVRLRLTKNKAAFIQRTAAEGTIHNIVWKKMTLHVTRSVLQDTVDSAFREMLSKRMIASYPIHRRPVTNVILPRAVNITIPRFVTGMIPRRIFVAFVKNQALTASTVHSPFLFEHMNVREMWLNYDGKEYPTQHYETNFANAAAAKGKNKRAYDLMRKTVMPMDASDGKFYMNYRRWIKDHTLFGFDLTPDQSGVTGDFYKTVRRTGDVQLELRLEAEPPVTMTAVVMCEYDNEIDIRVADGQPILDW